MNASHQIIYKDDKPEFAVVPWDEYVKVFKPTEDEMELMAYRQAVTQDDGVRFPATVIKRLSSGENPVRVYREYYDMTQEELGEKVGVTGVYIGAVERGVRSLSKKLALKVASMFKVDVNDLEPWAQD
ncbi:helix-turn-helix domain-containing protein [Thalassospira sp. GO-4]|jgi:DNA-binding XRE family transcriptional regulator|uniref:helix-turn-helix transcriptional regulator n=1 Tax=Thalassospira sp. GO-4 TaxID=2946605 RepID=UPI0020255113|nr:helix-turn-helix domain-containing protein [Thalassospira sp. GO-4]URK18968.1 helix-turn-helix domain-containing protein [Thalassospira sp. GO-4]